MNAERTTEALKNLELSQYAGIRRVFGKALKKRALQPESHCSLFSMLALKTPVAKQLNEDCVLLIDEIGEMDAERKCKPVSDGFRASFREFNAICWDFWAEIAAIRALKKRGFSRFRAIFKTEPDGTTSDYEAYYGEAPAYVEVKTFVNMTLFSTSSRLS